MSESFRDEGIQELEKTGQEKRYYPFREDDCFKPVQSDQTENQKAITYLWTVLRLGALHNGFSIEDILSYGRSQNPKDDLLSKKQKERKLGDKVTVKLIASLLDDENMRTYFLNQDVPVDRIIQIARKMLIEKLLQGEMDFVQNILEYK